MASTSTKTLILMQGVPCSGKSTVARALTYIYGTDIVVSADDYRYTGENGEYVFKPSELAATHEAAQNACLKRMEAGYEVIIVDNINANYWAAEPYLDMAVEFEYDVQVIRVETTADVIAARNAERSPDRRIPEEVLDIPIQPILSVWTGAKE